MDSWLEGVAYGAIANLSIPLPAEDGSSFSESPEIDPTALLWSLALHDGDHGDDGEDVAA